MIELRLRFEKKEKAIYLSHLDLMRTMQRVFKRAGLAIKYSEGFNPHARIFIAMPLSLGYSSDCELIDIELNDDTEPEDIIKRINEVMPSGIRISDCYSSARKFKEIAWMRYELEFVYDNGVPENAKQKLAQLFSRSELIVCKRSKRKEENVNISSGFTNVNIDDKDNKFLFYADCACSGQLVLNPVYLINAVELYEPDIKPDFVRIKRTEMLDKNFKVFR